MKSTRIIKTPFGEAVVSNDETNEYAVNGMCVSFTIAGESIGICGGLTTDCDDSELSTALECIINEKKGN